MISQLKMFRRKRPISQIVTFLEQTHHKVNLSYNKVYYEFRKLNPLLGKNDVDYFVSYLKSKEAFYAFLKDDNEESMCRLIFCTKEMQTNYKRYSDILLLDTTYKTNKYQIPLLIFKGITYEGKNVPFGFYLMNQEDYDSYKWALCKFIECNKIIPNVVVTDQDPTLNKSVSELKCHHFICQWHLSRNLRKNFAYLTKINSEDYDENVKIYEKILKWPYIDPKEIFDEYYNEFKQFFSKKKSFEKSLKYINSLHDMKEKWSNAYRPLAFTAGTVTTSRSESINASIKRYIGAKSELSAIIGIIEDLEDKELFEDPLKGKSKEESIDEPLISDLAKYLKGVLFRKHLLEFKQSSNYTNQQETQNSWSICHNSIQEAEERRLKARKIIFDENSYQCSCLLYEIESIICRHAFHISRIKNMKTISHLIHKRWLPVTDENSIISLHNFTQKEKEDAQKQDKKKYEEEIEIEKENFQKKGYENIRFLEGKEEEDDISESKDRPKENLNEIISSDFKEEEEKHLPNFKKKTQGKGIRSSKRKANEMNNVNQNKPAQLKNRKK